MSLGICRKPGNKGKPMKRSRPQAAKAMTGELLHAKYCLLSNLATGEWGSLFSAGDLSTGETIAVKVFHPALSANPCFVRAMREMMEGLRGLSSDIPQIVKVYACDQAHDGRLFIAMELVSGRSLADLIRQERPLGIERAVRLAAKMADGLSRAHDLGFVHGDVQPSNFIVLGDESIKIVGLERGRWGHIAPRNALEASRVRSKQVAYLSPEQVRGEAVTTLTDVYGLGAVFYEMLGGRVPFGAPVPSAVVPVHLEDAPLPLTALRAEIPEEVETKVLQALAKDPAERQSHIADVANPVLYDLVLYHRAAGREAVQADPHFRPIMDGDFRPEDDEIAPPRRGRRYALAAVTCAGLAGLAALYLRGSLTAEDPLLQPVRAPIQLSASPGPLDPNRAVEPVAPDVLRLQTENSPPVVAPRAAAPAPLPQKKKRVAGSRPQRPARRVPPPSTYETGLAARSEARAVSPDAAAVIDWLLKRPIDSDRG
jgi:hypothetical protein